jgi:hypothetical protein
MAPPVTTLGRSALEGRIGFTPMETDNLSGGSINNNSSVQLWIECPEAMILSSATAGSPRPEDNFNVIRFGSLRAYLGGNLVIATHGS